MSGVTNSTAADYAHRLDIIVPVYNEELCLDEFYARMRNLGLSQSLIFVDNASSDGTVARIERYPDVRLIRHETNEGYGASVRHAIAATNRELIVIIDADLEYPPEAIPAVVAALEDHAIVYCSRFLQGRPHGISPLRWLGNRFMTGVHNLLFRQRTTDLYTGMKALRRSAFPLHLLRCSGFENAVELAGITAVSGHKVHDIAIDYRLRSGGSSKMRHLPVALGMLSFQLRFWFRHVLLGRPLDA